MRRLGQVQRGLSLSVKNISVLLCGAPSAPLGLSARALSRLRTVDSRSTNGRSTHASC